MTVLLVIDDEWCSRRPWLERAVSHLFPLVDYNSRVFWPRMLHAEALLALRPSTICWDNDLGYISEGEMVETSRQLARWLRDPKVEEIAATLCNSKHLVHSANNVRGPEIRNLLLDFGVEGSSIVLHPITQRFSWQS